MFKKGFHFGAGLVAACLSGVVLYAIASYPTTVVSFPVRQDGETITAAWFNTIHDEVAAIEAGLLNGFAHDLKFTDATYDIGKSGATRPRDGFFSRNVAVGGTLGVTGASTFAGLGATTGTFSSTLGVTGVTTMTGGTPALLLTTDAAATPVARTIYRDSIVVAWAAIANAGSPTRTDQFNVASLVDNGVGDVTLTFATAVGSANYACDVTAESSALEGANGRVHTKAAGSVRIVTERYDDATDAMDLADMNFSVICVGE